MEAEILPWPVRNCDVEEEKRGREEERGSDG